LVTINPVEASRLAGLAGLTYTNPEELLERDDFRSIVEEHVAAGNAHLAKYETIKYFRIVPHAFSEQTGELTPSLKVKRKVVMEKYRDLIEGMYPSDAV
jgi:long-chain acyl-CoA synthetase